MNTIKLFDTNNESASCAAFSLAWLTLSATSGQPLTNRNSLLQHPGTISQIQSGGIRPGSRSNVAPMNLGARSVQVLPASGFTIVQDFPQQGMVLATGDYGDQLSNLGDGSYYLTIRWTADGKNGAHAMACIIADDVCFFLEPQKGLYKVPLDELNEFLQSIHGKITIVTFKVYKVERS